MNLEQAQQLRKKLVYLEGLIAWRTGEYIWKVLIGPEDRQKFEIFRCAIDPGKPIDPHTALAPYLREELSVYFFLKKRGALLCRNYEEFLAANHIIREVQPDLFLYSSGYQQ